MTLVVALRWGQGVLVTSDARVSSGPLIYEEQKIFKISLPAKTGEEIDLAVMAGAGDAALIKQGYAIIGEEFKKWLDKQPSEIVYPSAEDIANIVNSIQSRLLERFCELRKFGVEPNCSLLLAVITRDGQPLLYTFDEGLAQLRQHGFALLGRGEVTGWFASAQTPRLFTRHGIS
jgi:20S proteasome alpha/beta subunit